MSQATSETATAARSLFDRAVAAYPLLVGYLGLLTLYAWQTTRHSTPWLFTDELQWADLSRGIAGHGHAEIRLHTAHFSSLYSYLIAPAWWLGATGPGYAAAKYINAAVMTASLFPAYALARLFVPRWPAVVCGVATAAIPSLAYTGLLIPEPLAYTWSALVVLLIARALLRPGLRSSGLLAAGLVIAVLIRGELVVGIPAAATAGAIAAALSPRGRRLVGAWTRSERIGAATLVVLALVWAGAVATHHSYVWEQGTYFHHRLLTYGLWAFGAFTIGVGVFPVFATLAWLFTTRPRGLDDRALFATTVGMILAFGTYTAVKASYLSTTFAIRVEERNLIYLAPVAFVVSARWAVAGRTRLVSGALAAGAVAYLLATTPYHNNEHLYSDALGLAILEWFNRTWRVTTADAQHILFGILAGSVLVAAGREALRRRVRSSSVAAVAGLVLAVLVVGWNLTGEIVAADASNSFSTSLRSVLPTPPDWIDRQTGRARTMLIGEALGNSNFFWSLEFWNRSIQDVWSVDGSASGPGVVTTPNFLGTDGEVEPQQPLDWAVETPGVEMRGTLAQKPVGGLKLIRLTKPIRVADEYGGVTADGWMQTGAWFVRFAGGGSRPGRVVIALSRTAACGAIPAARITIRLSRLRIDKASQPAAGRLELVRHAVVTSTPCVSRTVSIPATPPFRIDLAAARTFQSADGRRLSVLVSFRFVPGPAT